MLLERLTRRRSGRAAGGGQRSGAAEVARRRARRSSHAYERAEKDPTYVARAAILAALVELDRDGGAAAARARAERSRLGGARARGDAAATIDPGRRRRRRCGRRRRRAARAERSDGADQPDGLADGLHRHRERADPDRARGARRAAHGGQLHRAGAPQLPRRARRSIASSPNFVAQDGDPRGDGEGGPGYTIRDEINQRPYLRGTVGMALDWEDTGGSQFFITHSPQPHLDGRYTVFGQRRVGHGGRRSAAAVGSDPHGADLGRRELDRRTAIVARQTKRKGRP